MRSRQVGRVFDVVVATGLIVLTAPIFFVIAVLILLRSGRPVLYRGTRLGLHKKPFTMYKFRTLVPDAQSILGARILEDEETLIAPMGRFLRASRLDELPQLFHIVTGEMQLVGPRPVRPEVYRKVCAELPAYEQRFTVPPGLIGPSQLFTPHGAPKILRSAIDNKTLRQYQSWRSKAYLLSITAIAVLKQIGRQARNLVERTSLPLRPGGPRGNRRQLLRIRHSHAWAEIASGPAHETYERRGEVSDINRHAFKMVTREPLEQDFPCEMRLTIQYRALRTGATTTKSALVRSQLVRHREIKGNQHEYVLEYTPISDLSEHILRIYFLEESFARPE